jgi:IS5 family transposase
LLRARLDQFLDLNHELAKFARAIDWRFLEGNFGAVYTDRPGRPSLPTRLMAGLAILKHTFNLSDEEVCARLVENPCFGGKEFFRRPAARSLFDHPPAQPHGRGAPRSLEPCGRDPHRRHQAIRSQPRHRYTTVQPKNITFPTDAKLVNRAREKLLLLLSYFPYGQTHELNDLKLSGNIGDLLGELG